MKRDCLLSQGEVLAGVFASNLLGLLASAVALSTLMPRHDIGAAWAAVVYLSVAITVLGVAVKTVRAHRAGRGATGAGLMDFGAVKAPIGSDHFHDLAARAAALMLPKTKEMAPTCGPSACKGATGTEAQQRLAKCNGPPVFEQTQLDDVVLRAAFKIAPPLDQKELWQRRMGVWRGEDERNDCNRAVPRPRSLPEVPQIVEAVSDFIPIHEGLLARLDDRAASLAERARRKNNGVIGFFGDVTSENRAIIERWAGYGQDVVCFSPSQHLSWLKVRRFVEGTKLCFVDADFFGDTEDTIDFCFKLRNASRKTPLVLVSSDVQGHDLTATRAAICDATLKPPLSHDLIQLGVSAARQNRALAYTRR